MPDFRGWTCLFLFVVVVDRKIPVVSGFQVKTYVYCSKFWLRISQITWCLLIDGQDRAYTFLRGWWQEDGRVCMLIYLVKNKIGEIISSEWGRDRSVRGLKKKGKGKIKWLSQKKKANLPIRYCSETPMSVVMIMEWEWTLLFCSYFGKNSLFNVKYVSLRIFVAALFCLKKLLSIAGLRIFIMIGCWILVALSSLHPCCLNTNFLDHCSFLVFAFLKLTVFVYV